MSGRRREYEAPDMAAMLRRMARAMARRGAEGDLEILSALVEVEEALEEALGDAARGAHAFGYSWTEIAREIGVTRQAARQRFANNESPASQ